MSPADSGVRAGPFASVALPVPVRTNFTYAVPPEIRAAMRVGRRVRVPLGRRRAVGTVVEWPAEPPAGDVEIRPIAAVLEDVPEPGEEILELTRFVSEYYLCSWGEAIVAALPPDPVRAERSLRAVSRLPAGDPDAQPARARARRRFLASLPADGAPVPIRDLPPGDRRIAAELARRGLVSIRDVPLPRGPAAPPAVGPARERVRLEPTPAQAEALARIGEALDARRFAPIVLFGATGSGKTEVYLRAAEASLDAGRGVLYLVPEIGLTPLLMDRLRARFGTSVEVMHSALPRAERLRAWTRVRDGDCRFVVGTRSAVFAPVRDLGLLVVDEEHDASYKQEETPRYNGRDLAVLRAKRREAVVVLGSATPSLESFRHASSGRYALVRLGGRVHDRPLAEVAIVDMRAEFGERGEVDPLSRRLLEALGEALDRGEQALVLRNRRGWAVAVLCPRCGNRAQCRRCSVTLTLHRRERRLRCHACGFERAPPRTCDHCGFDELRTVGEGSERVEAELRRAFPAARIERMDRDTVRRRGAHEAMLQRFERREIDVLVGTQMIAKGHDFPDVTLVGVLSADQSLGIPDFRAGERTFQLLTQVAGRAGRGERGGRVVLQAFDPRHTVLREAVDQDYERFFEREIEYRRAMRYPPFTTAVKLVVQDADLGRSEEWAGRLAEAVREAGGGRLLLTGPGPAPVERLRNRWRQQVLVRSAGRRRLIGAVAEAIESVADDVPRRAITVDVDPYSLL